MDMRTQQKRDGIYDGTGVPTTKSETRNRKGKRPDGTSKSREVKLGCVFTQVRTVKGEPPQRDPDSTTYVARFDESVDFGGFIRHEAILRGMAYARKVVVLGDGSLMRVRPATQSNRRMSKSIPFPRGCL